MTKIRNFRLGISTQNAINFTGNIFVMLWKQKYEKIKINKMT